AFADVIARADDERGVSGFEFVGELRTNVAGVGGGVENDEIFFERMRAGDEIAFGVEADAGTVENETVVAADLIDVDDGNFVMAREGAEHVGAEVALVEIVGRGGDVNEDVSSLPYELGDGIAIVEALRPIIFVVPGVFADGDAELLVGEFDIGLRARGLEVTGFVENIVSGEKHFALAKSDFAVAKERGAIRGRLAGLDLGFANVTDDGGKRHFGGKFAEGGLVAFEEGGTFDEILRRVAAEAEFGKDDEVSGAGFCVGGHFEHAGGVAEEVADGWIELGESDFHVEESGYRKAVASG